MRYQECQQTSPYCCAANSGRSYPMIKNGKANQHHEGMSEEISDYHGFTLNLNFKCKSKMKTPLQQEEKDNNTQKVFLPLAIAFGFAVILLTYQKKFTVYCHPSLHQLDNTPQQRLLVPLLAYPISSIRNHGHSPIYL